MKQESKQYSICVLGAGSFGTALANMLAENNQNVCLWVRDPKKAEKLSSTGQNEQYLPGVKLNPSLRYESDIVKASHNVDILFFAIPSKAYRPTLKTLKDKINSKQILVSAAKGIETDTFLLMSEIIHSETGSKNIGVLSGPNLAKEIVEKKITASVIASENDRVISVVQHILTLPYFRVYSNKDRYGVELAGALKNIYAIAAGIAAAKGLGDNTKSMLITRSLAEMSRMAEKLGGNPLTFLGLAGVGDLIVTCSSPLSRNYQFGYKMGQGLKPGEAEEQLNQTVEGINTIRVVATKAKELGVYMPLASGLNAILFDGKDMDLLISGLMLGEHNKDVEFVI